LHGLWEFCLVDATLNEADIAGFLSQYGFTLEKILNIGETRHIFTHMVWQMRGFYCQVSKSHAPQGYTFVEKAAIRALAIPTAIRAYANYIQNTESV